MVGHFHYTHLQGVCQSSRRLLRFGKNDLTYLFKYDITYIVIIAIAELSDRAGGEGDGRMKASARWIRRTHLFRRDEYVCSACKAIADEPAAACPACGAVMSGKQKYDPSWVDEMETFDAIFDD